MKRIALALIGASALTCSAAAHAAPTINYTPGKNSSFSAIFSSTPGRGKFDDIFQSFTIGNAGTLSGTISTANAKFVISAFVKGAMQQISFNPSKGPGGINGGFDPVALTPGTYFVEVSGKSPSVDAGYSGTLNFDGVPEPGTWALMIVGFGAVGFAMRRQRATYRVAYN